MSSRGGGDEEEEDEDEQEKADDEAFLEEFSRGAQPERTTLHQDVAGLKLFLDILNGPDPEAEAELRLVKGSTVWMVLICLF